MTVLSPERRYLGCCRGGGDGRSSDGLGEGVRARPLGGIDYTEWSVDVPLVGGVANGGSELVCVPISRIRPEEEVRQ